MIVADRTKVGEWNMSLDYNNRWWVTHRPSESQWHIYGPYDSKEEAFEESGMPKPKTELEEVWEVAKKLREFAWKVSCSYVGGPYPQLYYDSLAVAGYFDALARKYKKES